MYRHGEITHALKHGKRLGLGPRRRGNDSIGEMRGWAMPKSSVSYCGQPLPTVAKKLRHRLVGTGCPPYASLIRACLIRKI